MSLQAYNSAIMRDVTATPTKGSSVLFDDTVLMHLFIIFSGLEETAGAFLWDDLDQDQ